MHRRACPRGDAARPPIGWRVVRAVPGKDHRSAVARQVPRSPEERAEYHNNSVRTGADGAENRELRILSPVFTGFHGFQNSRNLTNFIGFFLTTLDSS